MNRSRHSALELWEPHRQALSRALPHVDWNDLSRAWDAVSKLSPDYVLSEIRAIQSAAQHNGAPSALQPPPDIDPEIYASPKRLQAYAEFHTSGLLLDIHAMHDGMPLLAKLAGGYPDIAEDRRSRFELSWNTRLQSLLP